MTDEVKEQKAGTEKTNLRLDKAREFICRVKALDRGELATLKRNAGNTVAEARGVLWFYRLLDDEERRQSEVHFLVATLVGLNKHNSGTDFGRSMGVLKNKNRANPEAVERRFRILLDADFDRPDGYHAAGGEIVFRLRQMVKLAGSHEVGIDWARLLADLQQWGHPSKHVQKRWAESFYAPPAKLGKSTADSTATDSAADPTDTEITDKGEETVNAS